jgi:uncharacterized membrane protein
MQLLGIIIGVGWIFVAVVIILVCLPLTKDKIPPNRYYGMRLPKAFTSDEAWYAINRYGGKQMIMWAVPMLLCGIVIPFLPISPGYALLLVPVELLFVIVPSIKTFLFAKRYGKDQ